jgi:hypothetical protein
MFTTLLTLFTLFTLFQGSLADVSISKPLTGQTYAVSGGSALVSITWIESNANPKLSEIDTYTFVLCSGPNSQIYAAETLAKNVKASDISGYSYDLTIDSSAGQDGYYYIQILATTAKGWTIHYSNRFQLTGMSGTYEPSVGAITIPPDAQTSLSDGTNTGIISIDSRSFTVPYGLQTGKTRYAPMQTQPGTTVTKDKSAWSRQFPTSSVSFFSTFKSSLEQASTITPGWSYTISSAVNWASPAPQPSENGGWYAASERLKITPSIKTPSLLVTATT